LPNSVRAKADSRVSPEPRRRIHWDARKKGEV